MLQDKGDKILFFPEGGILIKDNLALFLGMIVKNV